MSERLPAQQQSYIAALRVRDFRLLWGASVFSSCAYWALLVSRNWLVQNLSNSAGWVGLVTFANMLPFFVATPFGGLLADRFDRRRLTALMQAVSALCALALAALTLSGSIQPWQVAVLAFIQGCARSVEQPATSAIIPNLVRRELLLNAIALSSVATFGSRLFGPGVGGRFTAGDSFLLTAILWGVAIVLVLRIQSLAREAPTGAEQPAGPVEQVRQTLRYIGSTPMISLIFWLVGLHCALTMSVDAILPSFTKNHLHASTGAYSFLIMAVGGGSLVGTFALAGLQSGEGKGRILLITGIGSGVSTALLGFAPVFGLAFFASALMGATQSMFMALANTLVQEVVPDGLRGRISSVYAMVGGGVMAFANLAGGYLSDRVGVVTILVVPSLLFVVLLLVISSVRPNLRRIYRTGTLELTPVPA